MLFTYTYMLVGLRTATINSYFRGKCNHVPAVTHSVVVPIYWFILSLSAHRMEEAEI